MSLAAQGATTQEAHTGTRDFESEHHEHRILIADDGVRLQRPGALLTVWGYEVQEAVDGKDALERAPAFRPHVVIADMVMPVIDGIGLLKPLAAAVPEAAVILLTAHGSIETAVFAMREGAYDY
jgi:DNA-binding NtrC family response regulator